MSLLSLPTEIIQRIFASTSINDVHNARQTCSTIATTLSGDHFKKQGIKVENIIPHWITKVNYIYANKQCIAKANTFFGVLHGLFELYLKDVLVVSGNYKKNIRSGKWTFYYETGKIFSEGEFDEQGKPTGTWNTYNEFLHVSEDLVEGVRNGEYRARSIQDNSIIAQGIYENGEREGFWDMLITTRHYVRPEDDTVDAAEIITLNTIIGSGNYVRNKRHGIWRFLCDMYTAVGEFQDDQMVDTWSFASENGDQIISFKLSAAHAKLLMGL